MAKSVVNDYNVSAIRAVFSMAFIACYHQYFHLLILIIIMKTYVLTVSEFFPKTHNKSGLPPGFINSIVNKSTKNTINKKNKK